MSLEAKLSDFIEKTSGTLGRIEAIQTTMQKSLDELKPEIKKIPLIEIGLNNHLTSHINLKRYFIWPVIMAIIMAIITMILKFFIKII